MKYLIMIYSTAAMRAQWLRDPAARAAEAAHGHEAVQEALRATGEYVASGALGLPEHAQVLTPADGGGAALTDGPFPELKEHMAGFYLVECDTAERAAAVAATLPEAGHATVEVRPLVDLRTL